MQVKKLQLRRSMKLSSKAHYGLNACCVLAGMYPEKASARELEEALGVSGKYLEQMMRLLASRGIVRAQRGAAGGYSLAREPAAVSVGAVVRALEDDMEFIHCAAKASHCKKCLSAAVWQKLYREINRVLDEMTLSDMLKGEI